MQASAGHGIPVANSVTSQPRATSPSAMLPATVSHAPYCRGGVLRATGERMATRLSAVLIQAAWPPEPQREDGGETGSVIGRAIRNDQHAIVKQSAAAIHNVRHVTFALIFIGLQQRLAEAAEDLAGIIAIEEERTDAVFSHRANSMAENQPSGIGFDGRTAVAELDQLPRKNRFKKHPALVPKWTLSENIR